MQTLAQQRAPSPDAHSAAPARPAPVAGTPAIRLRAPEVLALQRTAGNAAVTAWLARREARAPAADASPAPATGRGGGERRPAAAGVKDPLYLASRGGSGGQTAGDAITGRHLSNWAIASGGKQVRTDTTTRRMQESESADAGILADIYLLLLDRLWGRAVDPNTGSTEPDEFEGTDNARGEAVYELSGLWGPIESWLGKYLVDVYVDKLAEAMQLTPRGAELVLDPTEIMRIRTHPYGDITEDDRWGGQLRVGDRRGQMVVVDIYKQPLGGSEASRGKAVNPGRLWFYLAGRPLWYYVRSSDLRDAEAFVSEVSRQVTANTHLAAEMWPLLIKGFALAAGFVGGFGPTLAYRIATEIASIAIDEVGEEGVRAAAGEEGRSAGQILKDAGLQFLLNRVVDGAYHLGSYKTVAGKLGAAIDRSALALRHQVVALEQDEVVAAIRAGRERPASPEWEAKGYESEVEVTVDGQRHTYRRRPDGLYCRYTDFGLCELDLARAAQARAEARAPRAGETPEQWAERTTPHWDEDTPAMRAARLRAAPHDMVRAATEAAVYNPNQLYEHYLTGGGYEAIMRTSQLRSGAGVGNLGGGDAVRATPILGTPTAMPDRTVLDFVAPNAPVKPVARDYISKPYVAWRIPEGDMLSIEIRRVRFSNGATAIRIPGTQSDWILYIAGKQRTMTLDELLQLGEHPTLQ